MRPIVLITLVALFVGFAAGCQRATRYRAVVVAMPKNKASSDELPEHYAFLDTTPTPDLPIVFVDDRSPEWQQLGTFWNHTPGIAGGMRTIHLARPVQGPFPLAIAASMVVADRMQVIKIKVPRGLPAPTYPDANPPTYARWKLGKLIFFDPRLLEMDGTLYSCASCHRPGERYAVHASYPKTPSLINAAYNQHQFWDGRATYLEEVVVRELRDELPPGDASTRRHVFHGLIAKLDEAPANPKYPNYRRLFEQAFGVRKPTQDTLVKALATYMRTILAGDSLYDRAVHTQRSRKAASLQAEHFRPHLDARTVFGLGQPKETDPNILARDLAHGHDLFQGHARCTDCHPAPLFTDHDFHNVGTSDGKFDRLPQVPIGLKLQRYRGAYKTPTLRNLPATGTYFHDCSRRSLGEVVDHFNAGIFYEPALAKVLTTPAGRARDLRLTRIQREQLVLFLRSLDAALFAGTGATSTGWVDPIVRQPPAPFRE